MFPAVSTNLFLGANAGESTRIYVSNVISPLLTAVCISPVLLNTPNS